MTLVPDIRACIVCGGGVLCDEGYPAEILVICQQCLKLAVTIRSQLL